MMSDASDSFVGIFLRSKSDFCHAGVTKVFVYLVGLAGQYLKLRICVIVESEIDCEAQVNFSASSSVSKSKSNSTYIHGFKE